MPSDKAKAFVQDRITTHKVRCWQALLPLCTVANLQLQRASEAAEKGLPHAQGGLLLVYAAFNCCTYSDH
jgi:hypothetical protein